MAQSQWTLIVYKNTKGNNHKGYKVKDFKGKNLSRKRCLNGLYSKINGLKKEFI